MPILTITFLNAILRYYFLPSKLAKIRGMKLALINSICSIKQVIILLYKVYKISGYKNN